MVEMDPQHKTDKLQAKVCKHMKERDEKNKSHHGARVHVEPKVVLI